MEIRVIDNYMDYTCEIYLVEQDNIRRQTFYAYNDGQILGTQREANCASPEEIKPFLKIPQDLWKQFERAVINNANKLDIKTDNEFKIEGELKATKLHLQDMREIIKTIILK